MNDAELRGWAISSQMLALNISPSDPNALDQLYNRRRFLIRSDGERRQLKEAEIQKRIVEMCNEIGY